MSKISAGNKNRIETNIIIGLYFSLFLFLNCAANVFAANEAMMVYFSSTPTNPNPTRPAYRTFDGTNWTSVGFSLSSGAPIQPTSNYVVRAKPNSNERLVGYMS